jgi:plasmid stability protein
MEKLLVILAAFAAGAMASDKIAALVTPVRKIDDRVKERLRMRAATHGRSMEEEARLILRRDVGGVDGPGVWALSRRLFAGGDGVDLVLPDRGGDAAA